MLCTAVFAAFALLSPLFRAILRGKVGKELAFIAAWVSAPFTVLFSYLVRYGLLSFIPMLSIVYALSLTVALKRPPLAWYGAVHWAMAALCAVVGL